LSGPPGIGKTRLAVEAAQRLLTHFPDGVWWFDASRVEDPERLPLEMIRMLGMRGTPGKPPMDLLVERLYARQMLWVLDGLNRADMATQTFLQSLLQRTRHLRILTTAARSLRLEGSTQVRVGPLRTGDLPDPETNPAYALLLARIRQHRPEYHPDTRDQEALLQICRRLDGLPLALELAAARCRLRTPQNVLERLDETLQLPDQDVGAGDRRVQTLHQALQWNISQLDEEERRFLLRFSLFPDGLTAQAMEATVGVSPLDVSRLDALLSSLLDKSLIMLVDPQEPRYRIPETVRRWIHETPEARQEEPGTYRRYLSWILQRLERYAPELVTGESSRALSFFHQEKDNLRVVFRWARTHNPEGAQALGARLWRFFYAAGEFEEGRIWLTPLAETSPAHLSEDLATVDMGLGVLALYRGQMEEARTYLTRAQQRFHELQRPAREGEVLNIMGLLYLNTGDLEKARSAFEQALQLREAAGDASGVATVLNNLGLLAREKGDLREARRLFLLSFQKNQQLGRNVESARALANLAEVHQLLEEYSHAERRYEQALQIFLEAGDRLSAARVYQDLGVLAMDRRDWDMARERLERARLLFQELHHDAGVAGVSLNLATLAWKQGKTEQAGEFFLRALALFLSQHHARGIRTTLHHWLRLAAEQKDLRTFALLDVLWERLQERGMLPPLPDSLWELRQQIRQQAPEGYHEREEEPLWGLWERLDPLLESMPDMLWLE
ncbi:MAG: tetratricopeptide repeat protein, partial [Candidatus Hydrothermae bacterium]|nr:tetratricopeptide repeat protein [Candidatus Hydrothermae bacterium]